MIQQTEKFSGERIQENNFLPGVNTKIEPLIKEFGGYSFNKGVFRIHTYESSKKWKNIIEEYFLSKIGKFEVFGFDWMGRQFAINLENDNEIYIFDIVVHKVYIDDEVLFDFLKNLNYDLDGYFSEADFKEINISLKFNQSISHKIPLVLGGKDEISNMEVCDMEVDWGIVGQLHQQT